MSAAAKPQTEMSPAAPVDEYIRALIRREARAIFEELRREADEVGCVKVKTATKLLDMSEYRVRQLIREGRLRAINPTPNTIRIPLTEIRRFTEGKK